MQTGPQDLLRWLAGRPTKTRVCIECGAGLGELTAFFSGHFDRAIATDITPRPPSAPFNVPIIKASADTLPSPAASVDLLISMQALHFFDLNRALTEARRVLHPGGIFAALSWGEIILPKAIAQAYQPTFRSLAPHWEPDRNWVVSGYAGLKFPGTRLPLPATRMTRQMTLSDLNTEISGWRAARTALTRKCNIAAPDLRHLAPQKHQTFPVHWPILGQIFRA